jgi:GNAT superfamily N-acetyltransferase
MPPSEVESLGLADEPAAIATLAAAFAAYPLFLPLCPDIRRRPAVIAAFCRMLFLMAVRSGGAFGTKDRAAICCAWPPGREWPGRWASIRDGGVSLSLELGFRGVRRLTRLEKGFDAARLRHVPGPHWYIPLLGVRPEKQGLGLGKSVLTPVFADADRQGLPVYLETMPEANVPIYQRMGFTLAGQSTLALGLPNWELVRPASKLTKAP